MLKNLKFDRPRIDTRNVHDRSGSRFGNQLALIRQTPKAVTNAPAKIEETELVAPTNPQILHKEVFNNNMATVEVTVRATPQHMSVQPKLALNDKSESWRKVMPDSKGEEDVCGSFCKFDPLRTLHFLSKELELKLQLLCPDDPNLQQIVNDMQRAVQRLPPDVMSQFQETILKEQPCGDMKILNLKSSNQTVETLISTENEKQLQEKLEENIKKLEAEVKVKESVIEELRTRKEEAEKEFATEKETVNSLRKELEEYVSEYRDKAQKQIELLSTERDNLAARVNELEKQVNSQTATATKDLKTLIEDFRTKYLVTQKENSDIRNELAQLILNKEKLNMLLECKDKQLEELRGELRNIQAFICAQVNQFQSKTNLSACSSISSISKIWSAPKKKHSKCKDGLSLHSAAVSKMILKYRNAQAVDSQFTIFTEVDDNGCVRKSSKLDSKKRSKEHVSVSNTSVGTNYKINEKYSSMRAVFSEIKRQAFKDSSVTLSSCQPFNDLASTNSHQ